MTEARLQFDIVMWFNNNHKEHRGSLFQVKNETNKGAHEKGKGLVKGASDLGHIHITGVFIGLEVKLPGKSHEVERLENQLKFAEMATNRGGLGFFVFSIKQFQHIVSGLYPNITDTAAFIAKNSRDYIKKMIDVANEKGTKTVKLEWKDDYIYRPVNTLK